MDPLFLLLHRVLLWGRALPTTPPRLLHQAGGYESLDSLGFVCVRLCDFSHSWSQTSFLRPQAVVKKKKKDLLKASSSQLPLCPKVKNQLYPNFTGRMNKGFAVLSQYSPVSSGFHLQS